MHSKGLAGETEIFARYGVSDRLELGLGFLKKQGIVRPLVSYVLSPEPFREGLAHERVRGCAVRRGVPTHGPYWQRRCGALS